MIRLTEAEVDSLTECECGHYANEHHETGCLANVDDPDYGIEQRDGTIMCACCQSPEAINLNAIKAIVAAREATVRGRALTHEALAALLPPHHLGVPCPTCNASVDYRCRKPDGTDRVRAHAAREYRAWHVRAWLFLQGIDANKARP